MVYGFPLSHFEHIKLSKSAKQIWVILQDLLDGSENMKDKRLNSVVNKFDTFTTTPSESVALTLNRYRIVVNNIIEHDITKTPIEYT